MGKSGCRGFWVSAMGCLGGQFEGCCNQLEECCDKFKGCCSQLEGCRNSLKDAANHPAPHSGAGRARMGTGGKRRVCSGDWTWCHQPPLPPFPYPCRSTHCRLWPGPPAAAASPPRSSPCTSARTSSSVPRNAPARSSRAAAPLSISSSTRPKFKVRQRRAGPACCGQGMGRDRSSSCLGTPAESEHEMDRLFGSH